MKKLLLFLIALVLHLPLLQAQDGSNDLSFNADRINFGEGANGAVRSVVLQPDGKVLIGGEFFLYNGIERVYIARLNPDGSLDTSFDPSGTISGFVYSIAVQGDGKVLIGGSFGITRLNANGSQDTSFNPGGTGANSNVQSLAIQTDGKILIGGFFTSYNGVDRNGIARLNADGSLDTSFDPGTGAEGQVYSLALQPDGKVFIGGFFTSFNGVARNYIARLNTNGSLDTSFDPGTGADNGIVTMFRQSDGKLLIGGAFSSYNGTERRSIARLNANGSLDTSFNPASDIIDIKAVATQPDGKVLIAGSIFSVESEERNGIARLNADGSLDTSFNPGAGTRKSFFSGISPVFALALRADGKIVIGGEFTSYNGFDRQRITRINPEGSLDNSFNPGAGANGTVQTIAQQTDGKILIGGDFTSYNGVPQNGIARLNADGNLDNSFDPGTGATSVQALAVQPDGKILIGGAFSDYNGIPRNRIARLNADGSLDSSFDPGLGVFGTPYTIALQVDGKILIGGDFFDYNGISRNRIARINANGSLDTSFDPGTGADGFISNLAIQSDGKILIGGSFNSFNGVSRNDIARLNTDGSLDSSFEAEDIGSGLSALALAGDGKVLIGGGFFYFSNGSLIGNIARLNSDGSLDPSFNPAGMPGAAGGPNGVLFRIIVQSDRKILIAGQFSSYSSVARNGIARLNPDGSLDTAFDPGSGPNNLVRSLAIQADGKALIGGDFTSYGGVSRTRINRVQNTVEPTPDTEAPVADVEPLPAFEAQCVVNFADLTVPTATDNEDGKIQGRTDESIFPITTQGSTLITWTYTDRSGNVSTQIQEILIEDTELPVIFTSGERFESVVQGTCAAVVVVSSGATDNCSVGEPVGVRSDGLALTDPYPVGITTITWNVSDVNGNAAEPVIQTVTVTDNELPTITVPAELNISTRENGCDAVDVALGEPTVSDNCGIASVTNNAPETYPLGITTVTWTVTDANGNVATATQTVTVVDEQDPVVTAPAGVTVQIAPDADNATGVALGEAQASDNCGVQSLTNNAPNTFPLGLTVVTWTATDNSGNTATATQNVTVTRQVAPTITAPAAITVNNDPGACGASGIELGTPSVTGEDIPADGISNNAPTTFPVGTTVVTWTVIDGNGNTANATQQVTVKDSELPTITAPAAVLTSTGTNSCDAVVSFLGVPISSDNCGIASVTNNAPETYPLGSTIVTWTVIDINGNVATATQTVTVVDEQDPTVTAPADVTVQIAPDADNATGVSLGEAQISDNCGIASVTNNALNTFPLGTTVVTWTATDNSGNTATATQNVTVTREVLPTITAPAAINVDTDAGDCFATVADLGTPSVTGEDIPADGISNDAPTTFPVGTTVVTWTVRDGNGNTATATQQVTVADRELPAITAPAAVQTSTGTTSCDAVDVALGEPTVSDNCGIASVTNNAPETYPLGSTTVTWTVTDANGNVATATQTVTVVDEQDPIVTAPADVTVQIAPDADSATGVALGEAQSSDNCGVASLTNNAPTTFPLGLTVVTWTATDNSGNTATATQNVTVTREVLPTITAPAAINADTDAGDCFATLADLGTPSVTGEDIPADGISNDAPATFPVGTTVVTWTVRDGNGNTATATQQVTVADREVPAITAPAAVQTGTGTTSCDAVDVALGQPTVSDNCGIASVTNNAPETYPLGSTTVTWTVTDANGNVATATQTVTVVDEQDPIVTAPADVTVQIAPDADSATGVALGEAQASDNCGVASLTNDAPTTFPLGLTVVTWTATDNSGNTATAQQRVNVTREELPTIQAPADITTDAGEGDCFAGGLDLGSPTFTGTGASVSNDAPDQFPVGVTTVTWTVTDANGNTATAVQKVTVADRQAPQLTAPGNIVVSEGEGGEAPAIDLGNAVATDNCGIASIENDAPAVFPVGMTVVTWTATDVNGNASTALQVVTVDAVTPVCTIQIKTKPEITVVLNKDGKGRLTTAMVDDGTSSSCGAVKLTLSKCDFTCADIGEQKITFTAVDAVGTRACTEVTVKVVDRTKPKVTVPQRPFVKVIRRGDTFVMPDLRNRVTASDNCGFELHQCPEPGKVFRNAQNGWIEFEAKDPSGNVGKGKMKFKLLVVGCRKPGKNGREDLEGSESLVTVPWNTPLPKIASDYVYFEEGSDMELAQQIKWSIIRFRPAEAGLLPDGGQPAGGIPGGRRQRPCGQPCLCTGAEQAASGGHLRRQGQGIAQGEDRGDPDRAAHGRPC
jgi:uncharacterized delta-60 repeat protein